MKNLTVKLKVTIMVDAWFVGNRQQYVLTISLHKMVDRWFIYFLKVWYIFFFIFKSKYVQRSQWDYFIKGLWVYFILFYFIWNRFWMNFLQIFIKNTHSYPKYHMFCVNHCWINMKISKCANLVKLCILVF